MTKLTKEQKFDALTYLELASAALEETYSLKAKGLADNQINKKIKHDLGLLLADFNKVFFETRGSTRELWNKDKIEEGDVELSIPREYCLEIIGRHIKDREGHKYTPQHKGISCVSGIIKCIEKKDYKTASAYFGKLAKIAGSAADSVGF